jgi:hypothetical protein
MRSQPCNLILAMFPSAMGTDRVHRERGQAGSMGYTQLQGSWLLEGRSPCPGDRRHPCRNASGSFGIVSQVCTRCRSRASVLPPRAGSRETKCHPCPRLHTDSIQRERLWVRPVYIGDGSSTMPGHRACLRSLPGRLRPRAPARVLRSRPHRRRRREGLLRSGASGSHRGSVRVSDQRSSAVASGAATAPSGRAGSGTTRGCASSISRTASRMARTCSRVVS